METANTNFHRRGSSVGLGEKERIYAASPNYESYAVECEGMTQGLMLIDTRFHRSQIESSRRMVYISFLATAPWNRSLIQTPPT